MKTNRIVQFIKVLLTTGYYLLVAFPLIVSAAQVSLQWDANDPIPDGYRLFQRQSGQAYNYTVPIQNLTGTNCTVDGLEEGTTYYFVVRAYVGDDESGDSNEVEYTPAASQLPADPDSDGDGQPDSVDSDDDNDGMPDAWEEQFDGLDPLVDDAQDDLDGDGISNLDEYANDSDPTQTAPNTAPVTPLLSAPIDGAEGIDLAVTLVTGAFSDNEGDSHASTQYQIATDADFSALVYDHTSDFQLTELDMIDHILEPETTYYWRVRFYDQHNTVSEWSDAFSFTTADYYAAGDANANGVLDSQEVDGIVDLDENGTPDVNQSDLLCVATPDSVNPYIAVKCTTDGVLMGAIKAYAPEQGLSLATNQPDYLSGLISFKLYLTDMEISTVSVTVFFSQAAPSNSHWYKYDAEDGWSEYPDAIFSADRKSVTLSIEDGGPGDQDGVRNGIIVDPAGLGYSATTGDSVSTDAAVAETGCFIGTSALGFTGVSNTTRNTLLSLMVFIVLGLISYHSKASHRKEC